jgi:hypothetical protein
MALYSDLFHSFSVLITEITLHWWRMFVCQYVYILFALPLYGCRGTFCLNLYVTQLQLQSVKNLRCLFCVSSNSLTAVYCM